MQTAARSTGAISIHTIKKTISAKIRLAAQAGALAALACFGTSSAHADSIVRNGGYHAQVTNHWCASASMEMMLDVPAVRGTNAAVNSLLSAPDGATVAFGDPTPIINGNNQVTFGAQSFIYGLIHGTNFAFNGPNSANYFNPNTPVGAGSDNQGIVSGLNILDSPQLGFGQDNYSGFNLAPTLQGQALASRTIANALEDYAIPAQATVENGAHAICVYGVSTNGTPANGANYTINGFLVHDPWTGYVYSQASVGNLAPLAAGGWGLGWNTYLRNGYNVNPNGTPVTLPNGQPANVRLGPWNRLFTPAPGQAGTGPTFAANGIKFTVEPQGPESLDTGNLASDDSFGAGLPSLPEINGPTADLDAISDLAANPTLNTEVGLTGGSFDSADEVLTPQPGDPTGEGDWLVPYDGSGGVNDVTGAIMIDADTGVIDEATWLDPSTDGMASIPLTDLDQMFADQSSNLYPNDNSIPEPASLSLLALAGGSLVMRRKR